MHKWYNKKSVFDKEQNKNMWGNINAVKYYKNSTKHAYEVLHSTKHVAGSGVFLHVFLLFLVNKSSRKSHGKPPKSRQRKVWLSLNVLQ